MSWPFNTPPGGVEDFTCTGVISNVKAQKILKDFLKVFCKSLKNPLRKESSIPKTVCKSTKIPNPQSPKRFVRNPKNPLKILKIPKIPKSSRNPPKSSNRNPLEIPQIQLFSAKL